MRKPWTVEWDEDWYYVVRENDRIFIAPNGIHDSQLSAEEHADRLNAEYDVPR